MGEVIRKLPVKYIVRFRCVNKSWYRFIGSSSFIKSTISNTNNLCLLCTHSDYYTLTDLSGEEENEFNCNINRLKHYDTPKLYGIKFNPYPFKQSAKVNGICNGLLCVSDSYLHRWSKIYLWNPVIRKAKKISIIPRAQLRESARDADLCFGYFHDDYKVIRIAPCCRGKMFRVGVYSLSTDAWKITYYDSAYDADTWKVTYGVSPYDPYDLLDIQPSNKFVGSVAYFVKYEHRLICYDLYREMIREVQFPDKFGSQLKPFSLEPCGESVALIGTSQGHLTKWVLRNCAATNTSTWEKIVIAKLETPGYLYPLGFTKHGKYLLRTDVYTCRKYLWDFEMSSQLKECTSYTWIKDVHVRAIDSLVGNLVLLDEEALDPYMETEPCSTQTIFELHKLPSLKVKKRTDMLDTTWNQMQGRRTDIEKPRKKGGKEMLDNTQNQLQGKGTKRRKEDAKMEKPRKKERKELLDKTHNVLQGTGAKRRMEETEMEKPRKKGRKETLYKTQSMLQ